MSGRRHHDLGAPGVQLGAIITPMLDMAFQILSFFIMTYHPSAFEGHVAGSLVPPEKVATKGQTNVVDDLTSSVTPDALLTGEAVTVYIKAGLKAPGEPHQFLMKRPADTTDQVVADTDSGDLDRGLKTLDARLREVIRESTEKTNVKIKADGEIRNHYVMQVYDVCKKAGFAKVHFVPPPLKAGN